MIVAVDFDGTIVKPNYQETRPERFEPLPDAVESLKALKRAGHTLLLWSARSNRALRQDPELDPLVRAGVRKVDKAQWERARPLQQARYDAMVTWVQRNLPGVFAAIDDGQQGKPDVDLFVDDKALSPEDSRGGGWKAIARRYA